MDFPKLTHLLPGTYGSYWYVAVKDGLRAHISTRVNINFKEHKLYGRAKFPIEYTDQNRVDTIQALQLKSKSGKDRAKIKFKLTIPANPNFDSSTHASNLLAMKSQSFSTYSVAQSATPTPQKSPKVSSLFKRNRGSIRSNQSSGGDYSGSRQSLDSAGFETQGGARESSSRNSNLQECNNIFFYIQEP